MHPVTIGTAGHIDHGKSALVRALTGTDPDRLAEEQRRGMTLDLGFAHLDMPGGRRVGIVDAPGHEALVHNMLAGAGGIDLVMLVVAADEGAMPQTREHVDILRFLCPRGGVVVINKMDLAPDPEWVSAVEEDLAGLVAGTVLDGAPVVRVSAKTGDGLAGLVAVLERMVEGVPARSADGPVRMPVDRSFTMQGFGTVVTGTVWSGRVRYGDTLVLLPSGRETRVRGVQVHGEPVQEATAGSRAAVNLAGIEKSEVCRGDVLATPGAFRVTDRLDVRLRMLPRAPTLRHAARLHVHIGAGETIARVALIGRTALGPGEEGLAQLRMDRPVVAVHGDRFVVRRYSPTITIGGGIVLNPAPPQRRRRAGDAAEMEAVEQGGVGALVAAAVAARGRGGMPSSEVAAASGVPEGAAREALAKALADGLVQTVGDRLYAASVVGEARRIIEETLGRHHRAVPWRRGMPREELKSKVQAGASDRLFDAVVSDLLGSGGLAEARGLVALASHVPQVREGDRRVREALLMLLERRGVIPSPAEEIGLLGPPDAVDRAFQMLADEGLVVQVAPDLRLAAATAERVRQAVVEMARVGTDVTVASLRDRLQTNRRTALALLEYLDSARATRRVGDRRILGPLAERPLWPSG
ncbi:MAG: selenocysteine-specific translation elongation factor [Armatimonadetes bacterium]|nr:selenocysteine-specific translation elongation factor [Armatimonadota bacterium]